VTPTSVSIEGWGGNRRISRSDLSVYCRARRRAPSNPPRSSMRRVARERPRLPRGRRESAAASFWSSRRRAMIVGRVYMPWEILDPVGLPISPPARSKSRIVDDLETHSQAVAESPERAAHRGAAAAFVRVDIEGQGKQRRRFSRDPPKVPADARVRVIAVG
jgi:hypothetical protein